MKNLHATIDQVNNKADDEGLVVAELTLPVLPVIASVLLLSGCQSADAPFFDQLNNETDENKKFINAYNTSHLPKAPVGYKWQVIPNMTDEFTETTLDKNKWNDSISTWKGRHPARFLTKNVKVVNGNLALNTSTYTEDSDGYTMGGAAVSGKHSATYGYFEARVKASKTKMSTTFWLHSDKQDNTGTACNTAHATEIDILEAIGGWPDRYWTDVMHANTHYKGRQLIDGKCQGIKYISQGVNHDAKVNLSNDFHIYAAWWVTPNLVNFYFDNKLVGKVELNNPVDVEPFNSEMSLRMVSETYTWQEKLIKEIPGDQQPYPTDIELDDISINTSLYDYVRSYELIPVLN